MPSSVHALGIDMERSITRVRSSCAKSSYKDNFENGRCQTNNNSFFFFEVDAYLQGAAHNVTQECGHQRGRAYIFVVCQETDQLQQLKQRVFHVFIEVVGKISLQPR